mmetsp:Transcript_47968/g.153714  ORF Transcript_47968/g.153714 Transcript_47968/m.153714 type:complete len:215 (+) Transcript_47968:631-1275(+)
MIMAEFNLQDLSGDSAYESGLVAWFKSITSYGDFTDLFQEVAIEVGYRLDEAGYIQVKQHRVEGRKMFMKCYMSISGTQIRQGSAIDVDVMMPSPEMADYLNKRIFVPEHIWEVALRRASGMIMTLVGLSDKFKIEVLKEPSAPGAAAKAEDAAPDVSIPGAEGAGEEEPEVEEAPAEPAPRSDLAVLRAEKRRLAKERKRAETAAAAAAAAAD